MELVHGRGGAGEVGHQFPVESIATIRERLIVLGGSLEQVGGFPTVATPVRSQVVLHILYRV